MIEGAEAASVEHYAKLIVTSHDLEYVLHNNDNGMLELAFVARTPEKLLEFTRKFSEEARSLHEDSVRYASGK